MLEVIEDALPLGRRPAERVRRAGLDPVEQHVPRRAEEYDDVEAVGELALVGRTTGDEQRPAAVLREQRGDRLLPP